jgi:hypothetical protein
LDQLFPIGQPVADGAVTGPQLQPATVDMVLDVAQQWQFRRGQADVQGRELAAGA